MKPKLYLLFLLISSFLLSCKTAKKLYEKGNYDEAVELAAKKLQKDPDDPKLLAIIRDAYAYADADHQQRIRSFSESNNELKWEWTYNEYLSLQRMHDAIFRVPSVFDIVNPPDYSSYLITYGERAGDVRFDRGLTFMERGDKQGFRQAYREFQAALQFKPGHRDIELKLNEAYELAVTNVIVLPIQQQGGFVYSGYRLGAENFDDQMIRNLQNGNSNDLVRYYSAWEARSHGIRTDQVLDMRLSTFNIGRYHDQRSNRKVSKEVVIKETVYRPDSIVKEYGWVHANITTTRRAMHSDAVLEVSVRDERDMFAWSDRFSADHNWATEFSTYTGDERALSDNDKQQINHRQDYPPSDEEIMRCMLEQISNNALYRIRSYFNQY
jgi:hypothetical protein